MQRVSHPTRFRRLLTTPVRRALALLVAVAQMTVVLAPALHSTSNDGGMHFEAGGTRLHYTHDETACPACSATIGGPIVQPAPLPEAPPRVLVAGARAIDAVGVDRLVASHPRAPPLDDRDV